jgi:hypothetical protein
VDTWHAGAIACYEVGDMVIGYVACGAITYCHIGDMAVEYVETTSGTCEGFSGLVPSPTVREVVHDSRAKK